MFRLMLVMVVNEWRARFHFDGVGVVVVVVVVVADALERCRSFWVFFSE